MIFGPPKDCSMMTLRPKNARNRVKNLQCSCKIASQLTFWSERNTNCIRKDVDALENARSALVRELDLLVCAPSKRWLRSLGCSTTERPGRGGRQAVHFIFWGVKEKKLGRMTRKEEGDKRSCEFYETPLKFYIRKTLEGHVIPLSLPVTCCALSPYHLHLQVQ